jgi:hypothetical protein
MDITELSLSTLKHNRATYANQSSDWAKAKVAAIDEELLRRKTRKSHKGATPGYVLTATGQYEHQAGSRPGYTRCGAAVAPGRAYGARAWWHCLACQRAGG